MRLNSIKLSGFKSFAEPTNFLLPGQLVGVVGPNGCGKSNIMDAVRWVLGESRASELRGESMQDVIFNGTTTRKQASRSSVELVFDNADHRAGGQWAPVRRDRGQARADARRHLQLLHQQPAGAPARRAGRVPRHRPRPARLRHHRPGHDQPDHRIQARGTAPVPRRGRRRLQVQGAPPRDREPAAATRARTSRASKTSCASSTATSKSWRSRPRSPRATTRCNADATRKQHQLWFLKRTESEADQAAIKADAEQGDQRPRIAHRRPAPHREPSSKPCARRTTRPATRSTRRRASCTKPAPKSAGSKARSASWSKAASASSSAWCSCASRSRSGPPAAKTPRPRSKRWPAQGVERRRAGRAAGRAARRARRAHARAGRRAAAAQDEANAQRGAVGAGAAADPGAGRRPAQHRRTEPPAQPARASACAADQQRAGGARRSAPARTCRQQLAAAQEAAADSRRAPARTAGSRCRSSTTTGARASRPSTPKAPARPTCRRGMEALKALQEKVKTDGKLAALARQARPRRPARPVEPHPHRAGLGKRARIGAARAPGRARSQSRLDMVRAFGNDAPPAKLAFYSPPAAGVPRGRGRAAAPVRPAAPERRRPAGAAGRLAARLLHRRHASKKRWPQRDKLQPGEAIYVKSGHAVTRAQRELLCAGFRAGRPAGAPAGNREPGAPAARPDADRRRSRAPRWSAPKRPTPMPPQRLVTRAARSRRNAVARARAAGRDAAPDAAGRADPRPQRADRRRPGRSRRAARGTAGAPRRRRGAASKNWTCSWPTARSAMPSSTSA